MGQRIFGLKDDHVAGIAAAPLQIARRRGILADRLHDFEEIAADRKDGIDKAEDSDARVAIGDVKSERPFKLGDDGFKLVRDKRDLSQAHVFSSRILGEVYDPLNQL
jgi:hypothetical protein